jgi:hypothetical protein
LSSVSARSCRSPDGQTPPQFSRTGAGFERDPEVRLKLAALLLADSLDRLQQAQILAAVAA